MVRSLVSMDTQHHLVSLLFSIFFSVGGIASKASGQLDTDCTTDYLDVSDLYHYIDLTGVPTNAGQGLFEFLQKIFEVNF